jgi:hypothetical protein
MRLDQIPAWDDLGLDACYEISLDLQPEEGSYTGRSRLTYTNLTGEALADLVFRTYPNAPVIYGGQLAVTESRVDGAVVASEVFLSDRTGLRLLLPTPLAPGETVVVELAFSGRAPLDFGDLPDVYGVFNYAREAQVLTLANSYPILAEREGGSWQAEPVFGVGDAVVSQTALYRVEVTAPLEWELITTGVRTQPAGETERGSAATFVTGPAREFTLIASPSFERIEAQVDGIVVRHWGLPSGESRWEDALTATVDAVGLFNARFGPYPYAELDVASVPLINAAGVEYPGLYLVITNLYEPDPQSPFLLGIVASHEVAHQWWYAVVGNDVIEHPWQDEALAVFSSLLYQEVHQPRFYEGTLQFYQAQVSALDGGSGESDVGLPVTAFAGRPQDYSQVVYDKGGVFLVALRERMGDGPFFQALQTYYREYRFSVASPDALLGTFEEACDCSLDAFFAQWGVDR